MPHEENSSEKHTGHKDGERRTEQPENGRQSPPSATKDPGSESSTGSGENQKNMDPTKLQNHEEQPGKRRQSQPSGVEDKDSGPQSDSEGKQENLNHTKLQNKKTKDGEGKVGSSSQSLQEQPRKAAQSQSSHVEDQDSRSSPDSEGKQENTKSSNLEIKEAGISSENGSGSPSDSVGNQENPTEMLNKKMLHEKDSLQNHPYHKDGEGSSQEHQGKRRHPCAGEDMDTCPDSGGNQENTNKLQKKEMFHGNDSSQTCPNHKAGESGTAFSRRSSREQPEKPTQSQASGVEETGLGSHSHSRAYQTSCGNDSSQMRECLNHGGGAGSSRQSSQEPHGKRRYSQSAGEDTGSGSPSDSGGNQESTYPIGLLKKEPECHMQLETLSATRDHTVLIDTKAFQNRKLIPYQGQHVWDGNHVKLPPDFPSKGSQSRWKVTQNALNKLMKSKASVRDVEEAIKTYNQAYRAEWAFDCLYSFDKRVQPQDNIFSQVIPKIAKLALQLPDLIKHPIPLLRQQHSHAITLSQEQISCLLANGFFCTFPHRNATKAGSEYSNFPTINFSSLFGDSHSHCARKIEKLRCLFHYFNTVTDKDKKPEGLVTFERICIPENELPTWKKQKETLTNLHVTSEGSIEKEGSGMLQVDFAAKFIGGGVLGKGLVQEEIRFLMSPELIVARLFTEKLADNECLRITGAQTYSITSGYSDSFNWEGPYEDATKRDEWKRRFCQIVAIDAISFRDPREQYTKDNIKRELNKAYVGFRKDPNMPADYTPAIATGNWGCGAFNGDPRLKALIQMMAAAVAERDLAFFTFGNKNQAQDLQRMHHFLKTRQVTVGKLYELLNKYCDHFSRYGHEKNVFDYIKDKTGPQTSQL